MTPHRRGPWSQAEDSVLLQLVHSQGAHNWVRISHLIGSRTPKQCRERYHQNLKPSLNHEPITPEEGLLIEKLVGEMGKRWAEIARRLQGRSDNAVKNWWNGGMNRRRRLCIRRGETSRCGAAFDERTEQLSFARPVDSYDHTLVTTTISSPRRNFDTPLPSPSMASETSRTDSADGAPSLVSDSASSFSVSPRLQELPPLNTTTTSSFSSSSSSATINSVTNHQDTRRPSLPIFHVDANMYVSDSEAQNPASFAHRLDMEHQQQQQRRKDYDRPSTPHHYHHHRALSFALGAASPLEYHHLRGQAKPDPAFSPPKENLLPPLRLLGIGGDRDTRMTLSSILG